MVPRPSNHRVGPLLLLLTLLAPRAFAEVVGATPADFTIQHTFDTAATPSAVFNAVIQIGKWWSNDHTYSGDASNLSIELKAGGCFCERLKDGGVAHGTVLQWKRDSLLRLSTALGPLQSLPVAGVLDFAVKVQEGKTRLTVTYRVSGAGQALDKWAPKVDDVWRLQVARLKRFVETGTAG